ncbi:hypothetical protein OROMI_033625 [Orobanche minor]
MIIRKKVSGGDKLSDVGVDRLVDQLKLPREKAVTKVLGFH